MGKAPLLRPGRGPRELVEALGLPPAGQQRAVRGGVEGAVRGLPREQHLQRLRGGGSGPGGSIRPARCTCPELARGCPFTCTGLLSGCLRPWGNAPCPEGSGMRPAGHTSPV